VSRAWGPMNTDAVLDTVEGYLLSHHLMVLGTFGPLGEGDCPWPHVASVFYAVRHGVVREEPGCPRSNLELVFAGKVGSRHGLHVAAGGTEGVPAAATVTEHYSNWRDIKGVQLWGRAFKQEGNARAAALAVYLTRFPFARDLIRDAAKHGLPREIGLFTFRPYRAAFTDNSTGVFGRVETSM